MTSTVLPHYDLGAGISTLSINMTSAFNATYNITSGGSDDGIDDDALRRDQYNNYALVKVANFLGSYFIWVVFAFGLPGNIASIFTILTMPTVSSSKAHVAILAVMDTLAIISKVTYLEVSGHAAQLTTPGCKILMFTQQFCSTYVNWVVVAMTSERCLAVCFPLRVGRMYTRRKALAVLAGFAVMIASVYLVMLWAIVERHSPRHGYYCTLTGSYGAFVRGQPYYWLDACVATILPCALVLTGNFLIVFSIRRARKAQRHLTETVEARGGRKSRDQRQITVMLVAVSVVFLLLNTPNAVFYIFKNKWYRRIAPFSYAAAEYAFTARFIHALSDTNHAVNFYLYFLSMSSFRRKFIDSVRCRSQAQRRGPSSSVYRTSQTYMHCSQMNRDASRTDISPNAVYSAYGASRRYKGQNSNSVRSSNSAGSAHSLKAYNHYNRLSVGGSNNNSLSTNTSQSPRPSCP